MFGVGNGGSSDWEWLLLLIMAGVTGWMGLWAGIVGVMMVVGVVVIVVDC